MSLPEKQERFIVNDGFDLEKLKNFLSGRDYDTIKPMTDRMGNTMFGLRKVNDRFGKVFKNRGLIVVIDYDLEKDDPDVQALLAEVYQLVEDFKTIQTKEHRKLGGILHSDRS